MADSPNVAKAKEVYRRWHESKGQSVEDWLEIMADEVNFLRGGDGRSASRRRYYG